MLFKDEYEFTTESGREVNVSVEGRFEANEYCPSQSISYISITDEYGQALDELDDDYTEIYNDALDRDYEVELHTNDFDYSDNEVDSFLKEQDRF